MSSEAAAVALLDPKYPHNVGQVLRACAAYGVRRLAFSGERMKRSLAVLSRLPREERLRGYQSVSLEHCERPIDEFHDFVPVAVEVRRNSETLPTFEHPERALYVFGPEDGGIGSGVLATCVRFVAIPGAHCFNLSMAVGIVLYDRQAKRDPQRALDMSGTGKPGYFEVRHYLPAPDK